ncbi:MAG: electron transfer flavoprotein subunit beta/FixA family protein [Fusobacteriaceae bacterium]
MMLENDWVITNHFLIDTSFVKKIINPYDECALELALKIKDKNLSNIEINALTIDDISADRILKNLYAVKFNNCIRIKVIEKDIKFCPFTKSNLISSYVKNYGHEDLIIFGHQSGIGDSGKLGLLTAELLGIQCVTGVMNYKLSDDNKKIITTSINNGVELIQAVQLPAILCVANSIDSYLRIPTLKDKINSKDKEINYYEADQLLTTFVEEDLELIEIYKEETNKKCFFVDGTSEEQAKFLYDNFIEELIK